MANDLDPSILEYWSRRMQRKHHKKDVFRAFASFEEQEHLKEGDTAHRPYRSTLVAQDYTRNGTFTVQDISTTDDYLTVNKCKVVPFYVDDLDEIQNSYKVRNEFADDAAVVLGNEIDGLVLARYQDANDTIDDGDIGGTASNGLTLTVNNIDKTFGVAKRKLNAQNISPDKRVAIISSEFEQILWERIAGKESQLGDSTGVNGHIGRYGGFELYMSNNLAWSGKLVLATIPTENDTITINGVTLRWKATIAQAGDIDIGASATISNTNLAAAINNSESLAAGIEGTLYWEVSAANRKLLKNIAATAAAAYTTFIGTGKSYVVVSETLSAAADVWTPALQIQHALFMQKGAIDVVIQKKPNVEVKDVYNKLGKNIVPWTLLGVKTFKEGTYQILDAQLRSDSY